MTRDEAIAKLKKLPTWKPYSGGGIEAHIDSLVELGILKLDDPKTEEQEAMEWLTKNGWTDNILKDIHRGGFKIVRDLQKPAA